MIIIQKSKPSGRSLRSPVDVVLEYDTDDEVEELDYVPFLRFF